MGKASSAKKVARAARAGGSRRSGQRRALGFPLTIFLVVALGLTLVLVARGERITNATPKVGDHIHAAYSTYTCVPDGAAADGSTTTTAPAGDTTTTAPAGDTSTTATSAPADASTTTAPTSSSIANLQKQQSSDSSTTTSAPASDAPTNTTITIPTTTVGAPSTTIAGEGDVPGKFQPAFTDATSDVLGIHTHGDGVIHTHPFVSSVAGRGATLGVFFDQIGLQISDTKLTLPNGEVFEEGVTKCAGGKDGIVEIAQWSSATDAANGARPNAVFTSDFRKIHLSERQAYTIAFLPEGNQIPIEKTISSRHDTLGDVDNSQVSTTTTPTGDTGSTTTGPASSDSSSTTAPADTGSTTSAPSSGSSSSSSSP
jgi:hypothetical protein